jgi:REP element-mobilizing transposase RayT
MARPLRIDIENGLYHVTSRGWERRAIVRDDGDRERWVSLLERVALRCGWRLFAWALISNHFHLYLRTPQPNLSAGMHDLNSGYASAFNRRYRRSGALFQGRFKAILVEDESHALELTRYLHLNAVRAKLAERPEEYAWSSYREYLGLREPAAWLDCQAVLRELGKDLEGCRSAYRRFVDVGRATEAPSPLAGAVAGLLLGSTVWVEQWRRRLAGQPRVAAIPAQRELAWRPTLDDVVEAVSRAFGVDRADLLAIRRPGNEGRLVAVYLARRLTDEGVGAIGRYFGGVSSAAISKTVQRVEARRERDPSWDGQLAELTAKLANRHLPAGVRRTRLQVKT